jgi:hypothetical protein
MLQFLMKLSIGDSQASVTPNVTTLDARSSDQNCSLSRFNFYVGLIVQNDIKQRRMNPPRLSSMPSLVLSLAV